MIRKSLFSLLGTLWAGAASADWALNMPRGVTELSAETYELHMMVFWWCVGIGVVVFGAMIISLFMHRKSKGVEPATFSHSTTAEVIWTALPVVILLAMALPAAETFYSSLDRGSVEARPKNSGIDPFDVENFLLEVDRPLVVPKGAKVRLLITSSDVVHSWWVPDLAIKKDAVPGIINETWFRAEQTGTFRGQCTELCGKDHGYMPIVVEVVEPDAYLAWVETHQQDGERVAASQ
jgi:cytochrome c oxidase subunit 2